MATLSRYRRTALLDAGQQLGTTTISNDIYTAVKNGSISVTRYIIREGERLDTIAGIVYGDAKLWWVIAAASGIGWPLQVPPGIELLIPDNIEEIDALVG